MTRDVPIREEMIRLGQLLKLAELASSGSEAKAPLAEGAVTVNAEPEGRRWRQRRRRGGRRPGRARRLNPSLR